MTTAIEGFLEKNKRNNICKQFSFDDFVERYKKQWISWKDLTIIEYSKWIYAIQQPIKYKAHLIITEKNNFTNEQRFFLKTIIDDSNYSNITCNNVRFISFLLKEIFWDKNRLYGIFIIIVFLIVPLISNFGMLELAKKIIEILLSLLGIYFAIIVMFFSSTANFTFGKNAFRKWIISKYFNIDKNLSYLVFFSIMFYIFVFVFLSALWDKWYSYEIYGENMLRFLGYFFVWFSVFLLYLNYKNLVDYYIEMNQKFKLWSYKDIFFNDNYEEYNKKM